METKNIVEWVRENMVDVNKLPSNPFINSSWIRHVFPMPYRLDSDEDYKCLTKDFFDALTASVKKSKNLSKLLILNYSCYATDLAQNSTNQFYWSIEYDWLRLCEVMDAPYSNIGLYIWDSGLEWALASVADEYLLLGGTQEMISKFEANYKSAEKIALDMVDSINNKHTFFGEDAAAHLPDRYRAMINVNELKGS
jgi:hypothetical protein